MKNKVVILFVLIFIFSPFVSKADEEMPAPEFEQILEQANLTVSVRFNTSAGQPSQSFHFNLAGFDAHSHDLGMPLFDVTAENSMSASISTFDDPFFSLIQERIAGVKLTNITCISDNPDVIFTRQFDYINFNPKPGANIDCVFDNIGVKTPVLIVPGLLGTEMKKGDELLWADIARMMNPLNSDSFMDPLEFNNDLTPSDTGLAVGNVIGSPVITQHFYDLLINEFKSQGYVEGTGDDANLFLFPYDWRYGASGKFADETTNVDLLAQKIQNILQQTGAEKIDIVAHSLGGLIVKKYVANYTPDIYQNNIRKAVFVGVPNTGAVKAIKVLLQGDNFGVLGLSDNEMKKIAKNMPAAYDLLPSQQYFDIKGSFVKTIDQVDLTTENLSAENIIKDLDYNETKSFLTNDHSLNSLALAGAEALHTQNFDNFDLRSTGIDLYAIDGCKTATIGKITEKRYSTPLGSFKDYSEIKFAAGDGTVILESATNLPIDEWKKYYALKADHGKMPSQDGIRQQILNILDNSAVAPDSNLITQDISQCKLNGKAISVFSPVNIFATDQNGNRLGLADDGSIINEILNASFEIIGEHKFLFLPTDASQIYTINLTGTGEGTFTIKAEDVQNDEIIKTEVFSNLPVTAELAGQVILGSETTLSLKQKPEDNEQTILPDGSQPPPPPLPEPAPEPEPEPEPEPPEPEPEPAVIEKEDKAKSETSGGSGGGGGGGGGGFYIPPAQAAPAQIEIALPQISSVSVVTAADAPVLKPVKVVSQIKKPAKKIIAAQNKKLDTEKTEVILQENIQQIVPAALSAKPGIFNYLKNFTSKIFQIFSKIFKK